MLLKIFMAIVFFSFTQCDERQPNVLRIAPVPMYNSFEDVWRFHRALHQAIDAAIKK